MDVPPAVERATDQHRTPVGGGSGRPALLVAIGAVALITVAILKPWGSSPISAAAATTAPTPSRPLSGANLAASSPETTAGPSATLDGPRGVVRIGALEPGRYTFEDVDGRGFNIALTVPAGWEWDGASIRTGERGEDAVITFFTGDVQVYADPCRWQGPVHGPWGSDLGSLMAALAAPRRSRTSLPVERAAPALDLRPQWPGIAMELTVPDNLDLSACDKGEFRYWVYEPERFYQMRRISLAGPGQHDYVWAVQILSQRLIIDASTEPRTPDHVRSAVMGILRSIVVGQWG